MAATIFGLVIAYLLGSLPFAVWVSQVLAHADPRFVGDGNPGAKNVYHHIGPKEGLLVAALDIGKGSLAVYVGELLDLSMLGLFAVAFAAVVGHNWSLFLGFRGGQGMAATLGVLLILAPMPTLVGVCFALITLLVFRNWDAAWVIGFVMIIITIILWVRDLPLTIFSISLIPMIGVRKLMQQALLRDHAHRG